MLLGVAWAPLAIPIYWLGGRYDPNLASIVALVGLYGEFLVLLQFWRRSFYQDAQPLRHCGLLFQQEDGTYLGRGLLIGISGIGALFGLEWLLGWIQLQAPSVPLPQLAIAGLIMALAVGFAEELLFRGWLLTELEQDYRPAIALWSSSFVFALAHYIRPWEAIIDTWPQFFGLLLLGAVLGWGKRSAPRPAELAGRGRLSLPIGLHAGLVWGYYLVNVGQLVDYTQTVPAWLTGIDRNPLAGIMGLLLLSLIGWQLRRPSAKPKRTA